MEIIKTEFEGVYLIENSLFSDNRGEFQKLYQSSILSSLDFIVNEHFFSVSKKGVIRGMHFQLPPFGQQKLVYVISGEVVDVIVDLRKNSTTFKKTISFNLNSENRKALFIPNGFAHGFQSLKENTVMNYLQSNEYNKDSDCGINPLSIGYSWPLEGVVISDKDKGLTELSDFTSPF